jgi:hypothetical protein
VTCAGFLTPADAEIESNRSALLLLS